MGGFNSGRRGGYGTVDDCLKLDMLDLLRSGLIRPGRCTFGIATWSNGVTQNVTGRAGFTADLRDPDNSRINLRYTTTTRTTSTARAYDVRLATTRPHYGGLRWWFVCPASGRRVRALYLAAHSPIFASRIHLRLGYPGAEGDMGETAAARSAGCRQ